MAKGGAKKTNQMLEGSYNTAQNFTNKQDARSDEAYGWGQGVRDKVMGRYDDLWNGTTGGGGGGGGGGGNPYMADLETIKRLGATSEDQLNRLRGFGLPEEWATTGGWTDPEQANFRARTTASVPGFYDAMKRNLEQRANVTGGYGPGMDAASMALARDQARGGAAASLESEGSLQSSIREGKKWGSETGAANERTIFGNQERALSQLISARNAAMARGDANAARQFSQQMSILSEMRQLRGETGAETEYDRLQLAGMGSGLNAAGMHMQNNPNVGFMDRVGQIAGAAAGLAPIFTGGFGGGGKKKQPTAASSSYYDPYMED